MGIKHSKLIRIDEVFANSVTSFSKGNWPLKVVLLGGPGGFSKQFYE